MTVYYKFISTKQSYDSHVTGCASAWTGDSKWESYLASIHDEYENHLAAALTYDESVQFDQTYSKDGFWIGFKGDDSNRWTTEHEENLPTFTRWAVNEPKSITGNQPMCAYIDLDGFWYSESCLQGVPLKNGILSSFEFLDLGGVFFGVKNNSKNFGNKKI